VSRENVEVLEQVVEALGRGDVDELLSLAAKDVVWIAARSAVEGVYDGHDGLRKFCADNAESFEVFRPEMDEVQDLGDRVLAVGTIHIRGRGSGVETDIPVAGIATFEQGKLTRWEDFRDRHLALEAVGLRK
jgi:ketosteroid isomerase-like protein